MKFQKKFIQDTLELDERIIPKIRDYITAQAWDLVEEEADKIIDMVRAELWKLEKKDQNAGLFMLAKSEGVSDVLHARGITNDTVTEAASEALLAAFSMKDKIEYGETDLEEYLKDLDGLQRGLKEILLETTWPKVINQEKFLPKGRQTKKGLVALEPAIIEVIGRNPGKEISHRKVKLYLKKTFTPDTPFYFDGYELYVDGDKIIQKNDKTGRDKTIKINSVGRYVTAALKKVK